MMSSSVSRCGVGGGYRLTANPKRLTLLDIIQIFEPVGPQNVANGDPELVTDAGRALRVVLDELDDHTLATFRSITISTMLKLMTRKPWVNSAPATKLARRAASRR